VRDEVDDQFEVVGDPEVLSDAFIDALAALLLSTTEETTLADEPLVQEVTRL
jgi:hypothetical protein